MAVYSATGTIANKKGISVERYLLFKHVIFVFLGIGMIYISHLLDYKYYAGISKILMIITLPLLLYTLVFGGQNQWCRKMGSGTGNRFNFSNIRFSQISLDHFLGKDADQKTRKY